VLIPVQLLKPGGRIILVGDTRQLPPTVLSKAAEGARLAQSLFERLERCGWPVVMLREQYRMHPAISQWPGRWFYDGMLTDGAGITAATRGAPFHREPGRGPFVVWDCAEGRERGGGGAGGGSMRNDAEARLAAALVAGGWVVGSRRSRRSGGEGRLCSRRLCFRRLEINHMDASVSITTQ
jgi:superfamily I DNA and/or RNA helicase